MFISRRIFSAVVLCLVTAASADAQEKVLKIGTEGASPPFNNLASDGSLVGFDIDIANALCAEMKVKCEFLVQDWEGLIPALQAGKFDAIVSSMSITKERLKKVDFTEKYFDIPPAIAVPKDSTINGTSETDLANRSIGAAASTTHFYFAEKTYKQSTVQGYPSSLEMQGDLAGGRLDAMIDRLTMITDWLATQEGACCKNIGTVVPDPDVYGPGSGIAVRKGDVDLARQFNEAIKAIRTNGKYKEINDKYFTFDAYGK
ncbi:transporter substrate-binding domain-containing protein [Mesorhizobium sp.]|uniref:transporter substrate-binding domain-containing protein n=1 Tax=Mesorhizobium sp. TaxID=1871066 RepID=UPI000FE51A73|nr:transporter substrate-binding domain-containing protein [Mesorhizobium sp.]RWI87921.1 MAG: transporter substrate-binding domain-containing protein [Mesorhizobium sp.]